MARTIEEAAMADRPFNEARSEAFGGRMMDVLNGAGIALMASIGHQTGLFDAMAQLPPATSQQIADAAGLQERYVREWLGAMVTGGVVDYDPAAGAYALPAEHAAWLTRAAGTNNLAVQAQVVPLLAEVEQPLIDCGRGHAINLMAQAFPNSRFVGYDFSEDGVRSGREEAHRLGLGNARFEARDVTALDAPERFDLMTAFDAIHDQAQPARVLAGIAEALRPDGTFLMIDIGASSQVHENIEFPLAPLMYTISCMHCMTVSLALDGAGLGAMWGEQKAREMLAEAGFSQVDVKRIEDDPFNNYYVAAKA
jgi:SAM-dependent methyltransferase